MNLLRLSSLYLRRHLFATLVTVVALAVAIASVTLLLKLELLSHSRFNTLAEQGEAIVGAKSGGIDILLGALNFEGDVPAYLPQNLFETLKAKKDIQFEDQSSFRESFVISHITPFLMFGRINGFSLVGTDSSFLSMTPANESAPKLASGSFPSRIYEVMIGSEVAEKMHLKLGDPLFAHASVYNSSEQSAAFTFPIVGILQKSGKIWDRGVYANLETAQDALTKVPGFNSIWKNRVLSYFVLDIKDGGEMPLSTLINQRTVAQLVFVDKEKKHLEEITGSSKQLQLLTVGALLFLSTLTVLAVFFTRIEARSLELAVLRALGYARSRLTRLLMLEGLWMGLASIILAAIIDLALSPVILSTAGAQLPMATSETWPWWMILVTGAFALIAILIASLPPLWRLYRQDVHTTLRNIS